MVAHPQTEPGVVRVPPGTWNIDPAHSSVGFSIKHLMIATVRGRFTDFEGTIEAAEDINDSKVSGVVRTASIDTNEPTRDGHLRSPDFFDSERFPEAHFESTRIVPLGGPNFRVLGNLTLKDVTREIELESTVEGVERDPWGNERVGLSAHGTIKRTDFGLKWQQLLESGRYMLGEDVNIVIDVSAVRAT
ncbi:MAG TPA: YceI family protein [Gaiellales bacterium]|jgi:polyisoprenoid-binding protein YceI|nr:YceI family protein [Gaiellales bacterium]